MATGTWTSSGWNYYPCTIPPTHFADEPLFFLPITKKYVSLQTQRDSICLRKDNTINRKDGRAVECGGLENRWPARVRGFESLSFRTQSLTSSYKISLWDFFMSKKMHQKCSASKNSINIWRFQQLVLMATDPCSQPQPCHRKLWFRHSHMINATIYDIVRWLVFRVKILIEFPICLQNWHTA